MQTGVEENRFGGGDNQDLTLGWFQCQGILFGKVLHHMHGSVVVVKAGCWLLCIVISMSKGAGVGAINRRVEATMLQLSKQRVHD